LTLTVPRRVVAILLLVIVSLPLIFLALRMRQGRQASAPAEVATPGADAALDSTPATSQEPAVAGLPATTAPPRTVADPEADLQNDCREITAGSHPQLGALPLLQLEQQIQQLGANPGALAQAHVNAVTLAMNAADYEGARDHLESARGILLGAGAGQDSLDTMLFLEALLELRLAEEANCAGPDVHALCLFGPLQAGGFTDDTHSLVGIRALERYLRNQPDDLSARWLLNIAHMLLRTYPEGVDEAMRIPLREPELPRPLPRFEDVGHPLGVATVGMLGGAIMDDFDGDGLLDLFETAYDPCTAVRLMLSDGMGGLQDVTASAGLAGQFGGFNTQQTDYDNDGALDIFITRGGWQGREGRQRNSLLHNEGDGSFRDVTYEAGLAEPKLPTQASAWADYDGDGDLDLYVGNESFFSGDRDSATGEPNPSQLFRNNGDGTFTDVAAEAGVTNDRWAKGVTWGDYDNDGDPDLYVSNIGANALFRNEGDGSFTDRALELGVVAPIGRSFATWFWDYDNDGWLDLYVAGYDADVERVAADYLGASRGGGLPRLYRNDGAGGFEDVTEAVGLNHVLLPMGANFGDFDGDGYPDIYLGTGNPRFETQVPNVMYWNDGGRRFLDVTVATQTGHLPKGHGVAFGDLDNDGDLDLFLQAGGFVPGDRQPNALFRNPGNDFGSLTLDLVGQRSNRVAIGARITVRVDEAGGEREIHTTVGSGGSFGANSLRQEIGLGAASAIGSVEVWWPVSGERQRFEELAVGGAYRVTEGQAEVEALELPRLELGASMEGHGG